ncbi:hypothetical protein [Prochlorococcus marinus]|uniref:hypothetical protein n=1 Tax=Prochlorococcus marinus TaxID=1219 RepID=UPI001F1B4333|nr:hypothetical protein [Prochlorococcus marinus]
MTQSRNGAISLFLVALGPLLISCSDLLARGDGEASLKDANLKSLEVYTFRRPHFLTLVHMIQVEDTLSLQMLVVPYALFVLRIGAI